VIWKALRKDNDRHGGNVLRSRGPTVTSIAGMAEGRMNVLLVDDHGLIREALRTVLEEIKPGIAVAEASNSRQAMRHIEQHPDLELVILDLNLPDRAGFGVLSELHERYPALSVVVLSAFHNRDNVLKALDLGALGFIPKTAQREVMVSALRLIFSGGIYVPPEILAADEADAVSLDPKISPGDLGLTERQMEVLALMMRGISNKEICRSLDVAEPTVKSHVSSILKALNVSNRTEAVLAVAAMGWELPRSQATKKL